MKWHSLGQRSLSADPLSALTHEPALTKGRASEKPHWICTGQIFKVQFCSNEVIIFALTFRLKAQQCNHHNLEVSYDLTKNLKSCTKLKYFTFTFNGRLPLCQSLRQREVNENSQIDQSQAAIDVNRHQADQANVQSLDEKSVKSLLGNWKRWLPHFIKTKTMHKHCFL